MARAVSRSATRRRPVFQVVISVKRPSATASVTHPPWKIFSALAPKNARSITRNNAMTATAAGFGHCHRSVMTTYSNSTVITIVSVTAMP